MQGNDIYTSPLTKMIIYWVTLSEFHHVIKNDKSVYAAKVKRILNFPYEFRKLYLIDFR